MWRRCRHQSPPHSSRHQTQVPQRPPRGGFFIGESTWLRRPTTRRSRAFSSTRAAIPTIPPIPAAPPTGASRSATYRAYWNPDATAADVRDLPRRGRQEHLSHEVLGRAALRRASRRRRLRRVRLRRELRHRPRRQGAAAARSGSRAMSSAVHRRGRASRPRAGASAEPRLIDAICDERLAFLQGLRTWSVFGNGWGRRVREVRAAALAWPPQGPPAQAAIAPAPKAEPGAPAQAGRRRARRREDIRVAAPPSSPRSEPSRMAASIRSSRAARSSPPRWSFSSSSAASKRRLSMGVSDHLGLIADRASASSRWLALPRRRQRVPGGDRPHSVAGLWRRFARAYADFAGCAAGSPTLAIAYGAELVRSILDEARGCSIGRSLVGSRTPAA